MQSTDKPSIYNIESLIEFNNPITLIDTPGLEDIRGEAYDNKIIYDIQHLFTEKIETLHSICLVFKATETRAHERFKRVLDKLFSLFGNNIKKNVVIILTFVDDFNDISTLKMLNYEKIYFNLLGNINELPHFEFNNRAYFSSDKEYSEIFENNSKNFSKLLNHILTLKPISLELSKKVNKNRYEISNLIVNMRNLLFDVINRLKIKDGINLLKENDIAIQDALKVYLNNISIIAKKEKELNEIALIKYDNENYGYCKKILNEVIDENEIRSMIEKTLNDIESIYSNEKQKEKIINKIKKELIEYNNK